MTKALKDKTGEAVTVTLHSGDPISSYSVNLGGGTPVGRADFIDQPGADDERVFFHTEVDEAFGGRGLAGLLVREALTESIRHHLTVVPVCPLFARHLRIHGDDFVAAGGVLRWPTPGDIAVVRRAAHR